MHNQKYDGLWLQKVMLAHTKICRIKTVKTNLTVALC